MKPGHEVKIETRKRVHRAVCECGWRSVWWRNPEPAETDGRKHQDGEYPVLMADPR